VNAEQITAKIQELRVEQAKVHPESPTANMRRFFELDDEINQLLSLLHKLTTPKKVPTKAQVDLMDYVLSDEYDNE
jgi:hypothetical protein